MRHALRQVGDGGRKVACFKIRLPAILIRHSPVVRSRAATSAMAAVGGGWPRMLRRDHPEHGVFCGVTCGRMRVVAMHRNGRGPEAARALQAGQGNGARRALRALREMITMAATNWPQPTHKYPPTANPYAVAESSDSEIVAMAAATPSFSWGGAVAAAKGGAA